MPKQINTPLPGVSLVRRFNLKGRFQPVLDETIVPVTIVEQDAPATKRIAAWGFNATSPGAGNSHRFNLSNPSTSGHLVVLTQFWAHSGTPLTDHYDMTIESEVGANSGPRFRDGRLLPERPIARTIITPFATAGVSFPQYEADATVYNVEFVIEPGQTLRSIQELSNVAFSMFWIWYEVPLAGGNLL